ncbi:uncharacterized protein LOC120167764, partial [Hibiscus syriacus]|uniref:uncharacterized protein LOC120167764 n=1 Tax=Hibiscus syriacus TaxID=106335 RepID=UPI001923A63C
IPLIRFEGGRDGDVHPVLKPVENLDQWKAVKSKGSTPLKLQKENLSLEQEVSVDASLSNWLSSRETTPAKKSSTFEAYTPENRLILGALTVEEINKYSASPVARSVVYLLVISHFNTEGVKRYPGASGRK